MKHVLFVCLFSITSVMAQYEGVLNDLSAKAEAARWEQGGYKVSQSGNVWNIRHENEEVMFTLTLHGHPGDNDAVQTISAMASFLGEDMSQANAVLGRHLAQVGLIQFTGSSATAEPWIKNNIGQSGSCVIGWGKYEITAKDRARILRITPISHAPWRSEVARSEAVPEVGATFAAVVEANGKPRVRDAQTGWAQWAGFKALFKEGKAVEVVGLD